MGGLAALKAEPDVAWALGPSGGGEWPGALPVDFLGPWGRQVKGGSLADCGWALHGPVPKNISRLRNEGNSLQGRGISAGA